MNWEAIGAIGEVLGAGAVVVSLAYVGIQIRQNTAEMRSVSTQSFISHRSDANFFIATNPELSKLLTTAVHGFEDLPEHEQFQFKAYCFAFYNQFDFAFHQYRTGRLEEKFWLRMENEIPSTLLLPGVTAWWEQDKVRYTPEFVEYAEARMREFDVARNKDWSNISNSQYVNSTRPDDGAAAG